jgi:hypothetical protein
MELAVAIEAAQQQGCDLRVMRSMPALHGRRLPKNEEKKRRKDNHDETE